MNERTSKRVAAIAGKVLGLRTRQFSGSLLLGWDRDERHVFISVSEIRALAASCLAQAPDKKRKPIRSPRKRSAARSSKCKPDHPSFPKFKRKVHAPFLRSGRTRDHLAKKGRGK